jgi:putative nucleotidyltransferase with HDIG domain
MRVHTFDRVSQMTDTLVEIETCRVQPGMFIHLDLGWMDHPFPWNRFKLRSEDEVRVLRGLGLKTVRYCLKRSDTAPLDQPLVTPEPVATEGQPDLRVEAAAAIEEKRRRSEYLARYRTVMAESRKELTAAGQAVRSIHGALFARPAESLQAARDLVDGLTAKLPEAADTVLYAINDKSAGAAIYNHSINVGILALLLANKLGLPAAALHLIGLGSLFHDVGMTEIPARVRNKTDELTVAEKSLLEDHCRLGERMLEAMDLPPEALDIVRQHHELVDGGGYPRRLRGEAINPLARLVAIIELYDEFCNSPNPALSLTPHEAMSQLFARYRSRLDETMLQAFIHLMGVYPPGSIVALTNDSFGKVLSVHPERPLQPVLLLFDAEIPREFAVPLDLASVPGLDIARALRPNLLPPEAFRYLAPQRRAIYYFGSAREVA